MNPRFRIWDKVEKKWLFSYDTLGGFSLMGETVLLTGLKGINLEKLSGGDYVIQQWTYVLDDKETPIYEGDIVKQVTVYPEGAGGLTVMFQVDYENGSYWIRRSSGDGYLLFYNREDLTVVGNIYENPEKLK